MYFVGSQKKLKRAHYEIQDIQPVFFYVTLNLHKTETSLKKTVGASPEGVCLIELVDCIETSKVFFSYYNVFCMNKRCVIALNYVLFSDVGSCNIFSHIRCISRIHGLHGGMLFPFLYLKPLHTI